MNHKSLRVMNLIFIPNSVLISSLLSLVFFSCNQDSKSNPECLLLASGSMDDSIDIVLGKDNCRCQFLIENATERYSSQILQDHKIVGWDYVLDYFFFANSDALQSIYDNSHQYNTFSDKYITMNGCMYLTFANKRGPLSSKLITSEEELLELHKLISSLELSEVAKDHIQEFLNPASICR